MTDHAIVLHSSLWKTISSTGDWPDFAAVRPEDFPAFFDAAMNAHRIEIDAISSNVSKPGFSNTVAAMERCGKKLSRVASVFYALCGAHTNAELQAAERDMSPKLSRHSSAIVLDPALFSRIDDVFTRRASIAEEEQLSAEDLRLVERLHQDFVRGGARLSS